MVHTAYCSADHVEVVDAGGSISKIVFGTKNGCRQMEIIAVGSTQLLCLECIQVA